MIDSFKNHQPSNHNLENIITYSPHRSYSDQEVSRNKENKVNANYNASWHLDPTMNPASIYFLHPSNSNQKLVNIVFSGRGFVNWKRVMTIALSGRNKLVFVGGSLTRPTSNSFRKAWDRVDNVVMGRIIAVLEDSIANSILSYKTSKDIWNVLNERYGHSSSTQIFSLQ